MYIKNKQYSSKFKGFWLVSNFVINRKFRSSSSPTFHIQNVMPIFDHPK